MDKYNFAIKLISISLFTNYLFFRKKNKGYFVISLPGYIVSTTVFLIDQPFTNFYIFQGLFLILVAVLWVYFSKTFDTRETLKNVFDKIDWLIFYLLVFFIIVVPKLIK